MGQTGENYVAKMVICRTVCAMNDKSNKLWRQSLPNMQLDAIDRRILTALQANARISNAELADSVGLSPSPCLRRVRALESAGVIRRYATLLEPETVGLPISVFVQVTLERQVESALDVFENAIVDRPEVMECYLMTGDSDYLLRVVVSDLAAYERFLKEHLTRVSGVASIKSSFALNQVKYSTELPLRVSGGAQPAASGRNPG